MGDRAVGLHGDAVVVSKLVQKGRCVSRFLTPVSSMRAGS
jgi:hypothetical protein